MSRNLFDDSDDNLEEDNFQIKTNENFAKSYNTLRKKELLQKFKDKGLDVSESDSDDSDSSEEDEVLDPSFDQDFLKTLASLKSKDPAIYDKNTKFFKQEENDEDDSAGEEGKSNKEKKSKPVTLKDYERKIILEKGGKFVDDSDEDDEEKEAVQRPFSPTVVEEERRLKAEFKKVMNQEDDSEEEEFGGIFKKREKTKAEKDKEEEDYLKWLAGKKDTIQEEVKEKLEPLKKYWSNDKLPSSEKFLRDYVLNKGYTEASNYNEIPTYEEIVGDNAPLSEDEEELEKQAEFEQKFNFRYEEPDQEFIKRYPRTIESSLRVADEKRKKKRQETKERKLQEKEQKMKELEMVKEMKRKEIQEKIEKLKMVTGNDELGFKDDDLEEDFDPEAHDRRMQELFNDEYYQVDEGEEKPECPSDIDELKVEDWDNYDPHNDGDTGGYDYEDNNDPHCEDEDFIMDCDYDPSKAKEELQKELIENTRKRRGGRKGRRDRFMEIIKAEKPVFDPEDEKTYGEYIDEYYKLDCEDIIGDTPCRFKYVETTPNDFGLTIEEILLAKNKELNQWASLKKAIQIRPDQVEKKEQRLYKLKAKNEELKRKIFKSLYGEGSDNENEETEPERTKEPTTSNAETAAANTTADNQPGESKKAKKRRKRKAQNAQAAAQTSAGEETQTNVGIKEENTSNADETVAKKAKIEDKTKLNETINGQQPAETATEAAKKKKKKNKKKPQSQNQNSAANSEGPQISTTSTANTNSNKDNEKVNNPFNKGVATNKQTNNVETKNFNKNSQKANNAPNANKPAAKNNPFAKGSKQLNNSTEGVGSLPPLRKNIPKTKTFNGKFSTNDKFKSKFQNKKPFNGKPKQNSKGDGKDISDERLKAYGINPRKFHKKQKYGNNQS
ncbi:protein KRI1 homolog [Lucilia sericata]|uniref:protein KRI1 homolog n=1 Tax=Lucilia sericata TaxID=13632 RepID=UPI0018A877EA|nr:protein KRI1 homolog [Lucilia sericata]